MHPQYSREELEKAARFAGFTRVESYVQYRALLDELHELKTRIKNCAHGPCPVLADLAWKEIK